MGWNFPFAGLAMFSKILLKTNSLARNVLDFTRQLCKFTNPYWYDVICTIAASQSSSVVSRSLAMASAFAFSGISVLTVDIQVYVGMMASISYMRANGDTPVNFRLVVL